jgi:pyridoxine kinase
MSIISIQSHVVYGYVGNKAAVYPLQSMGFDVWPINTVQFSSHAGYKGYRGEIFSASHIRDLVDGLEAIQVFDKCDTILSGYMGNAEICHEVTNIVNRMKKNNDKATYLCDPVIGDGKCYVKQEVVDFFQENLKADIITPNQFEAELLSGIKIKNINDLHKVADFFHAKNIDIVIITSVDLKDKNLENQLQVFLSESNKEKYLVTTQKHTIDKRISGTGDLFSALFLGLYKLEKDCLTALRKSVYYMDLVLVNTLLKQDNELQVNSISYQQKTEEILNDLPSFLKI